MCDGWDRLVTVKGEQYYHFYLSVATHYYKVSAVNIAGYESALSSAVSVAITDPVPFVTYGTVATAGVKVVIDIETTLGRKARSGTLVCEGAGDPLVGTLYCEISYDGSTYTAAISLRPEDYLQLQDPDKHLEISKIRLDADTDGTGYSLTVI